MRRKTRGGPTSSPAGRTNLLINAGVIQREFNQASSFLISFPSGRLGRTRLRVDFLQSQTFCFEIGLRIVIGGIEMRMAEPASNDRHINASGDEMDSGRVAESMRRDPFRGHCGNYLPSGFDVMTKLKANAGCAELHSVSITKGWFVRTSRLPMQERPVGGCRFGPQGTDPFLTALPEEPDVSRRLKVEMFWTNVQGFLDTRSGVVKKAQ